MTVYKARANFQNVQPKFKIFYENGSTYTDKSGPIDRAQKQGVVIILTENNIGQRVEKEQEFYCYFPHGWVGVDQYRLYQYLASPGYKLVLFGVVVDDNKLKTIYDNALSDNYVKGK